MGSSDIFKSFQEAIGQLKGVECHAVFAGKGTGSHVSMKFGKKYGIKSPVYHKKNDFCADFTLFVEEASWRVEDKNSVICTSTDNNDNSGLMVRTLNKFLGKKVIEVEVFYPSFDLFLLFEGGVWLKVFSTWANKFDEADNYTFFVKDFYYSVEDRARLKKSARERCWFGKKNK